MDEVLDQPVEEVVEDQPELDETQDDAAVEAAPAEKVDGRKFNPEWSKALKEMRELYPDRADMFTKLRDTYGRYQALSEIAPKGLDDVRGWKTTLDAAGGAERVAELMQRSSEVEEMDGRIANADFSVIGELPEGMQKGFYQMVGPALSHLAENDKQAFASIVQPHFASALAETGIGDHLQRMFGAAAGNEQVQGQIRQMYEWFQNQTSGKGTITTGAKTANPEVERLRAELDKRTQADGESFANSVADQTEKHLDTSFDREMGAYKSLNLNDKQMGDLKASVNARVASILGGDSAFQNQLKAFKSLKNRNPQTVLDYVQSHVDTQTKVALDDIVSTRYAGMKTKPQPRVADTTQSASGTIRVNKAPEQSEWDMDKMQDYGYEQTAKKGIYYLKGNKTVQLARA